MQIWTTNLGDIPAAATWTPDGVSSMPQDYGDDGWCVDDGLNRVGHILRLQKGIWGLQLLQRRKTDVESWSTWKSILRFRPTAIPRRSGFSKTPAYTTGSIVRCAAT